MRSLAFVLVALSFALVGCDGTISVTFVTGPQDFELSTAALALPSELDDGSGRIASVDCGVCPPSEEVTLTCEGGVCDPAPTTRSGPIGDVIDVDVLLAESREIGVRRIESITVEQVDYEVRLNTLNFDVGPVEIYWGPEAASAIDPALGVRRFATVPRVTAGTTPSGELDIDEAGAAALSDYLVDTDTRVRFFAETVIDLEPGDPYPEGSLTVSVNATMTAVGRVLE